MSDPQPAIRTSAEGGIGRIVLDNPKRMNAVSLSMWRGISQALADYAADPAIRCVIIEGAGDKAFCVGADISEFGDGAGGLSEAMLEQDAFARKVLDEIYAFPKPIIARIRGYCIGAGIAIATNCDLRVAATGSSFGIPAAKLGVGYYADGLGRLAALIGPSRAKMIMFTARRFDTEEAFRIGMIDEWAAPEALDRQVDDLARTIAAGAPLSIMSSKAAISLDPAAPEAERERIRAQAKACFQSADFAEGRLAFEEKRAPVFTGR